jgi:tRNA-uridine 2-sulfurtransferase
MPGPGIPALFVGCTSMVNEATQDEKTQAGVLVGMSGGVDSSVAAMLLQRAGYRVVGVTLRLWDDPGSAGERTCCSSDAVKRAAAVAAGLGMPHFTVDARELFEKRVVDYFVEEHAGGRTPNPCMKCNARVRFGFMLELAGRLGLGSIATGHYARLTGEPLGLARGVDHCKDQSYVLAEVAPELLRRVLFPLGGLRKPDVRRMAAEAGLAGASQPESQEICFIPDDDHRRFLATRLGDMPGVIVDAAGREVGAHRGVYNFTIGQRRGLRVAGRDASYVLALDAAHRLVTIGDRSDLGVNGLRLAEVVWHRPSTGAETTVQFRSSGGRVAGRLTDTSQVVFDEPAMGVAPGQTAVIYEGDTVVAAGTIVETV